MLMQCPFKWGSIQKEKCLVQMQIGPISMVPSKMESNIYPPKRRIPKSTAEDNVACFVQEFGVNGVRDQSIDFLYSWTNTSFIKLLDIQSIDFLLLGPSSLLFLLLMQSAC
jgi:hypothetical protein